MNKIVRKSRRNNPRLRYIQGMTRIGGILLVCVAMVCGCSGVRDNPSVPGPVTLSGAKKLAERNDAVSLLYDLFQDEKNLSKILIIKHGDPEFDTLIKSIAHTTGDAAARLEQMAAADAQVRLHALELPAGEKATRAAIAKTKEHELLFSSGTRFQFDLLLTQVDALSYGWHLAKIAAENSTSPDEARTFTEISTALSNLYDQDVTMLKTEARKSP